MTKPTLLIDLDGVIGNLHITLSERIFEKYGLKLTEESFTGWNTRWDLGDGNVIDSSIEISEAMSEQKFVMGIKPVNTSQMYIRKLKEWYRIEILTSRPEADDRWSMQWLIDNGFYFDGYYNVGNQELKSERPGSILIDDATHHATDFLLSGRPVIVYDRPWNQLFDMEKVAPVVRVYNWNGIYRILGLAYANQT